MKRHKFLLGNPCGPCEWHIERDVRVFAWFDLIFQSVFVIPVVLQYKIHVEEEQHYRHPTKPPTTTTPIGFSPVPTEAPECDEDLIQIGLLYSILDIINLSLGMVSDLLMYIGTKQRGLGLNKACVLLFLFISAVREILHGTGIYLHVIRCHPDTYGYEFVLRLLCQYMVYGIWISLEYFGWLHKGRLFVPQRGFMEPKPSVEINVADQPSEASTFFTSSTEFNEYIDKNPSSIVLLPTQSSQFGTDQKTEVKGKDAEPTEGKNVDMNEKPKKRKKSKTKNNRKSDPDEQGEG